MLELLIGRREPVTADGDETMTEREIQSWLIYWKNAGLVAVDSIRAFDQVATARRFCVCMQGGIFTDVTDLQIWRALTSMREGVI